MKRIIRKTNLKKYFNIFVIMLFIYIFFGFIYNGKQFNIKNLLLNSSLNEFINEKNILLTILDINVKAPKNIIYASLNKSVSKSDIFDSYIEDEFDYDSASSDYIESPDDEVTSNPIVYIYNSHQLEEYDSSVKNDYNIKPNVMIASYVLKEKLKDLGIQSIVETANIKKYLNKNKLSYSASYKASRYYIKKAIKEYNTLEYFIDIHRDSASIKNTFYEKNDKEYARILFVVGTEHKNYSKNLSFVKELNEIIESDYKGISRGILKRGGPYVNGVYNQDVSGNAILIEIGGVDNEVEQVYNTCEVIAGSLNKFMNRSEND